jgi:hypothetical protein
LTVVNLATSGKVAAELPDFKLAAMVSVSSLASLIERLPTTAI